MRFILSVILVLMGVSAAYALPADSIPSTDQQTKQLIFTGGPMVGGNLSNLTHSHFSDCSSSMRTGFYAGGAVRLSVLSQFSIEGGLSFQYRQAEFSLYQTSGKYDQWCTEIAFYAIYHLNLKNHSRLNFGIGPYTDFGLRATYRYNGKKYNLYSRDLQDEMPIMATSETGLSAKIGYEFRNGLEVSASYRISVSNLTEANNKGVGIRPQTVSLGAAWFLGKD